ncbi:MAG: cell division protein FtsZ [Alphaproteobacteria bacterium CG11_big_fil_rev_8_21_14_0_20_39_49]|nr:MAG: cell division protein FtsZ [Alphaproteobacteria bacterium CG11_big_fil_rev_8_21_14_0_20_39_49]
MALNIHLPENTVMKPEITVFGVGGAGGNATNNMIKENLEGVNFVVANTDAQALENSATEKRIQLGQITTQGLGAGAMPEVGAAAAEEAIEEIKEHLSSCNMVFITAGMGGGTGTGAAPVIARTAREKGILTVGVVTKPFHFEGPRRMKLAEAGLEEMQRNVDTLIVIPNQNLFRLANEKTTFADAFKLADNVLHRGVRGVTDLMVMPGLINLDFADVKAVMSEMGKAMMGTGEAEGESRAQDAAEAAISNPLLDNVSMKGARGVLINITGGSDMTLFEVDVAANRIREEVDESANIIFGSTFNDELQGKIRVSVVATGIDYKPVTETKSYFVQKPVQKDISEKSIAVQAKVDEIVEKHNNKHDEKACDSEQSDMLQESYKEELSEEEKRFFDKQESLSEEKRTKIEIANDISDDGDFFVPPSPVEPESYSSGDSETAYIEVEQEEDEVSKDIYEPVQARSGGLFQRMANAARGTRGTSNNAESVLEPVDENEESSEGDSKKEDEDLMDIPAFLRRKA